MLKAGAESGRTERRECENCDGRREHEVWILIRERTRSENARRSTEPCRRQYRVYQCLCCEEQTERELESQ